MRVSSMLKSEGGDFDFDGSALPMPPNKLKRSHHPGFHSIRGSAFFHRQIGFFCVQTYFCFHRYRLTQQVPCFAILFVFGGWEIGVEYEAFFAVNYVGGDDVPRIFWDDIGCQEVE